MPVTPSQPLSLKGMRRWAAPRAAQSCPGDRATSAWRGPRGKGAWEGEGTPIPSTSRFPKYARALFPSARALAGEGADAASDGAPHLRLNGSARSSPAFYSLGLVALLAACATQAPAAVAPQAPGFLLGIWHGFIFPVAWVLSLFMPDVSIYAVPNNGGWYDFGYFIGIMFLGVGARHARRR
jgi:hypothetical protein